jgi:hypothetical protein
LYSNTTGKYNTAIGGNALKYNTTGGENTAIGFMALLNNTEGYYNTADGFEALYSNTTGSRNTASGYEALFTNTAGGSNIAYGYQALHNNSNGNTNAALGNRSLYSNTTGNCNTAIGGSALHYNFTGSYNTAIGYHAGPDYPHIELSNTCSFGFDANVTASNTIRIGNSAITSIGGYAGWSNLSDGRFKTRIQNNVPGLDFIMKLNPVTFSWDMQKLDAFTGVRDTIYTQCSAMKEARDEKETKVYTGFIAQEVEEAAIECNYDFSAIIKPANEHSSYNLSYAEFVVPLVKAVQEQQLMIEEMKIRNEEMRQEIERLKSQISSR